MSNYPCSTVPQLTDPPTIVASGTHVLVVAPNGVASMLQPPVTAGAYKLSYNPTTGSVTWEALVGETLPTGNYGLIKRKAGATSWLTDKGVVYINADGEPISLTNGADGTSLVMEAGVPKWKAGAVNTANPGIVYIKPDGTFQHIANGPVGLVLKMTNSGPAWVDPSSGNVSAGVIAASLEGVFGDTVNLASVNVRVSSFQLRNATGESLTVEAVNVTVDLTAAGLGGLDTGVEGADQWYYVYITSDGTNVDGIVSLSNTAPDLTGTGHSFYGLISVFRNNSSSNIVWFFQRGRKFTTENIVFGEGVSITASWAAVTGDVALNTILPPNVMSAYGVIGGSTTGSEADRAVYIASTLGGMGMQIVGSRRNNELHEGFENDAGTFYDLTIADPVTPVLYAKVRVTTSNDRRIVINGYRI